MGKRCVACEVLTAGEGATVGNHSRLKVLRDAFGVLARDMSVKRMGKKRTMP